ncbi:MAG: response regulator [Bacteroidales bacterium]|jgi:CheY-like chemotaxis protein|nr:response regulator [Bacteroidales bacterium]
MDDKCQLNDFLKGLKPEYSKRIATLGKRIIFLLDERKFLPYIAVNLDFVAVKKILDVLIDNSIKFTDKGYIKVGYNVTRNNVLQFFIEDTGIGFDPETLSGMNALFSGVETETVDKPQTLLEANKLVQSINGKLRIESQKDMGTSIFFSITLPSIDLGDENESASARRNGTLSGGGQKSKANPTNNIWKERTILIAEDELVNYMFLEVLFEDTGATLIHASDGQQAIDLAKTHPEVELILMDIKMPNVNGLDATRAIKAFRPQTPIIAQTAYAMQDDEYKALQAGCNEYISKPIDANKLLSLMKKYLHLE